MPKNAHNEAAQHTKMQPNLIAPPPSITERAITKLEKNTLAPLMSTPEKLTKHQSRPTINHSNKNR